MSPCLQANLRNRQRGVVVLTVMLLVLTATTFVLLRGLNQRARLTTGFDQAATRSVLQEAKAALIGYAVAYPDSHSGTVGPGRLPCPDYAYQGASDPVGSADSCSLAAATETGLLPFRTIDANEMFDNSGARLWYAVSDNHRASNIGSVVNSETAGTLDVDGSNDIVAVIIAPGPALGVQDRSSGDVDDLYVAAKYLEGENASAGDNRFTKVGANGFNDQIITITRAELMAAVEQRVISTVSRALNGYFRDPDNDDVSGSDPDCTAPADCDDGYPWLAPFNNPATSDFRGMVGVREGHLPVVTMNQPFETTINFDWAVPVDGAIVSSGSMPPAADCVRYANCNLSGPAPPLPIGDGGATCIWGGVRAISCSTIETIDLGGGDKIEREYSFEFEGIATRLTPPGSASHRTLNFNLSAASLPAQVTRAVITLTDVFVPATGPSLDYGAAQLTLAAGDGVASIDFSGITFDLEIDNDGLRYPEIPSGNQSTSPGELPAWFVADNWHQLVVVAYAAAEAPGNAASDCTADASCLTVEWDRTGSIPDIDIDNARAVVMVAGSDLSGSRPSGSLTDYFEGQNATAGDAIFSKSAVASGFNDHIRTIDPDG